MTEIQLDGARFVNSRFEKPSSMAPKEHFADVSRPLNDVSAGRRRGNVPDVRGGLVPSGWRKPSMPKGRH